MFQLIHAVFLQVPIRQRNITELVYSIRCIDVINEKDTVIQMARCSFDAHILGIIGSLMIGSTIVMLHPGGTMDFNYLSVVLQEKQITCMDTVPSLYNSLCTFFKDGIYQNTTKHLRSLISAGM